MMENQSLRIDTESFIRRNIQLHPFSSSEFANLKAKELAEIIAEEIKKHGGSYEDVNQAVILIDNGYYKKMLKTDCHIEISD